MVARGFQRDRRETTALRFTGQITARGSPISVAVVFEDRDLTRVPKLYLLRRDAELPNAIAHIEDKDRLCYVREEELVLDPLNARGSVALCLIKMEEALDRLLRLDLSAEISREFPQHWSGAAVYSDLTPTFAGTAQLYVVRPTTETPLMVIAATKQSLSRLALTEAEIRECLRSKSPVHVISVDGNLTFANGQRSPKNLQEFLNWLNTIAPVAARKLMKSLSATWPSPLHFLINAPNAVVGGSLELPRVLAASIQRPQFLAKILTSWASKISIKKICGSRFNPEFVFERNMHDQPNLGEKRIALVGVGTIGGFLAKFLAQSGAGAGGGQLLLIDQQILAPGNIGRHFLGLPHIGKNKARAVQEELHRALPDCEIGVFEGDVLHRKADLLQYDLIVDATGERALSDVLNMEFVAARRNGKTAASALHVWLVGNGVAAQSLLVDDARLACFRCLRLEQPNEERFRLLRPDHPAQITPANCGEGAYFAYGVGAPAIAAGLAVQASLDWIRGSPSPRFRTIRVVREATYDVKDSDVPRLEKCPACAPA